MYYFFFILINIDVLALWGLLLGLVLFLIRLIKLAKFVTIVSALPLIIIGLTPISKLSFQFLEERFPKPTSLPEHIDGMVLLGGNFSLAESTIRGFPINNLAASRLYDFMALMRRYPHARVCFSGNSLEIKLTKEVMENYGIDSGHIKFAEAVNTRENIHNLVKTINPAPGENWLLVTSAFHIPRSVGLARGAKWKVIPYPVDYHTNGRVDWRSVTYWDRLNFIAWAAMVKEWAGLFNNWREGASTELLPGPNTCAYER